MDLEVADVSPQPSTEQLDEGFTATAYPMVQENLKLTVKEQVLLEEPASSSRTLSSLQHLSKDISFGDLFFSDKPSDVNKNTETKVESMVNVSIQQDLSSISPMTSPIIDLTSRPESPKPPPPPPLRAGPSGASRALGASGSSQVQPPPPPPSSTNQKSQSKGSAAPSSSKTAASAEYQAWMMTDIRLRKSISMTPADLEMDEDMGPDEQAQSSDDEDIRSAHIPKFWIKEECKYDIAAMYGISHWCFQRQQFYINRHTPEGDRKAVRTHMRILSVVRIEVFSMYGYDYMKKIVLRRADLNEHVIAERDFKYMYPSDFEYLYLLNLQGHLNHLLPKDKKILTTAVNQWTRHLMMMRFTEIHKFSDGTLQQINEALDYRVKEFRINRMNPGLNTRFWTRKDVDRSKAFMLAIQKRLKTRRIFRNLKSFVGGRVREGDYRLLKRNE
nr:hypothetical protein [Tanacetum cinerariifolium]